MHNPFRRHKDDLGGDGDWTARLTSDGHQAPRYEYRTSVKQRLAKPAVIVLIGVVVLLVLNNIVTIANQEEPQKIDLSGVTSPTRAAATDALQRWLSDKPTPLPGGHIVTWDRAVELRPADGSTGGGAPQRRLDLHTFTVAGNAGTFTATLTVASNPDDRLSGAIVGTPGLTPDKPAATPDVDAAALWPGTTEVAVPDPVSTAIQTWAAVMAGGTGSALRQAVGDPDPGHAYVPIAGARVSGVTVDAAAGRWNPEQQRRDDTSDLPPATMLIRIAATLTWDQPSASATAETTQANAPTDPATSAGDADLADGSGAPLWSFDLLVTGADGGAPHVVAWGGPGTGSRLQPYANAVPTDNDSETSDSSTSDGDDPAASTTPLSPPPIIAPHSATPTTKPSGSK